MLVKFSNKIKYSKYLTKKIFITNETEIDPTSPPKQYAIQGTEMDESLLLYMFGMIYTEAVAERFSVKKVFLEISQNSQENTCASHLQLY